MASKEQIDGVEQQAKNTSEEQCETAGVEIFSQGCNDLLTEPSQEGFDVLFCQPVDSMRPVKSLVGVCNDQSTALSQEGFDVLSATGFDVIYNTHPVDSMRPVKSLVGVCNDHSTALSQEGFDVLSTKGYDVIYNTLPVDSMRPVNSLVGSDVVDVVAYEVSPTPYKHQIIQKHVANFNGVDGEDCTTKMINQLAEFGIDIYVIRYDEPDLFGAVKDVCKRVSGKDPKSASNYQCCLFQDEGGRLFNVIISGGSAATGLALRQVSETFSCTKAILAIVLLSKTFSCVSSSYGLNPTIIALILGLVCNEEMSYVSLNAALYVQGYPSAGAYSLMQPTIMDWPKKIVVTVLAVAGSSSDSRVKIGITWFGVFFAVFIMFANLGSRAWRNMCFGKQKYFGPLHMVIALVKAFVLGFFVPYFGSRACEPGGRTALVNTFKSSLIVAIVFILSGFWDEFYSAILIQIQETSPTCSQDYVYIAVGSWYTFSLLTCICSYKRIIPDRAKKIPENADREPFLIEDWSSPVGYKVPNFPDFSVDPAHVYTPLTFTNEIAFVASGAFVALIFGSTLVVWGISDTSIIPFLDNGF